MMTLLDGQTVDRDEIRFNADTYHFFWGLQDITTQLRRADKLALVPDFDVDKENQRIYAERYAAEHGGQQPNPIGSTSTLGNFTRQLLTDPLAAPLDALNAGINKLMSAPGIIKAVILIGVGVGLWWLFKRARKKGDL